MVNCSVVTCGVNHKNNPENCTFHRFPLDPVVREKWLILIGRVDWTPRKSSTICSKHFPDLYKRKIRMNTILVKGALPTLFVPGHIKEEVPILCVNNIPSTSQWPEISVPLSPSIKKLMSKNFKLKQRLREKQRKIRTLVARTKRQSFKIAVLQNMLKGIHPQPGLIEQYTDLTVAWGSELTQYLINRVNDKKCDNLQSSTKDSEE
ncbi:unnamed protein product [Leptidea sinapis]|uniref:THAP-type domain-containing protein n=1 Tax=Leptidea sinapis TaxID=189913 RepID=A0A5E4R2W0_9NEOP|nr:unnamed protein product [Leptidea sinapis]